jgi:hypothetical protein
MEIERQKPSEAPKAFGASENERKYSISGGHTKKFYD